MTDIEFEKPYAIRYESGNPEYAGQEGFPGAPPDLIHATSLFDVTDYLRDNVPDDVEVIAVGEADEDDFNAGTFEQGGLIGRMVTIRVPDMLHDIRTKIVEELPEAVLTKAGLFSKKYILTPPKFDDGGTVADGFVINRDLNKKVLDMVRKSAILQSYDPEEMEALKLVVDISDNDDVVKAAKERISEMSEMTGDLVRVRLAQTAIAALTDANFHSAARLFVMKLEGTTTWTDSFYKGKWYKPVSDVEELGRQIAAEAEWDGVDIAYAMAYVMKMTGLHNNAKRLEEAIKPDLDAFYSPDEYAMGGRLTVGRSYKAADGSYYRYLGESPDSNEGNFMDANRDFKRIPYSDFMKSGGEIYRMPSKRFFSNIAKRAKQTDSPNEYSVRRTDADTENGRDISFKATFNPSAHSGKGGWTVEMQEEDQMATEHFSADQTEEVRNLYHTFMNQGKESFLETAEKGKWIQAAIKHPGALRKEAKREGLIEGDEKLSKSDLEKLEAQGGKTGKRASLARTLSKMR